MSFYCDDIDTALGGLHTSIYTGLGLPGADVPASGTDGASVLYPCITLPGDAAVEVFAQLVRLPTAGVLNFSEDGSFDYTGASDYLEFRLWAGSVASTADIGFGPGVARVSLVVAGSGIAGTAAGVCAVVGTGSVIGSVVGANMEPITLAEARLQCRIAADDTTEDAMLAIYIQAAREAAEQELGRMLIARTFVQVANEFPRQALRLQRAAVVAVTSVEYRDEAGSWQTLPTESYVLDNESGPGWLLPAAGTSWPATADMPGSVRITYSAGYGSSTADIPAGVRQWILLNVAAMYAQREALDASGRSTVLPARFVDRLLDAERLYG